jgi:hypothetical protein
MFEMVIASSQDELERGFLSTNDALDMATDIVNGAAEWYDSGSSPWKIVAIENGRVVETLEGEDQ